MNVRLKLDMDWQSGIWYDNQLQMNNYQISLNMITNSENGEDHVVSMNRIKHFIYNELDSTIFINQNDVAQIQALAAAGCKVTTLPEEPIDQIIGIAIYLKLNAVLQDRMTVTGVDIMSGLGDNVVYLHDEQESIGPFTITGWWNDPGTSHSDYRKNINKKNVVKINRSSSWKDLDLEWPGTDQPEPTANTVVFAQFTDNES